MVAARDTGDARVRDAGADDGVLPAGLALVGGEVLHVAAGWLYPPCDPAQPAGPVLRACHEAGDLGDLLVLLGGAVLGDARLPRAGGDGHDGGLVGFGDRPAAGEVDLPLRG